MNTIIQHHIGRLEAFFDGTPWYGSNYSGIISSIAEEEANWWPPNGHSIHRLLLHMIKWRISLSERLLGNMDFRAGEDDPDNWPEAEEISKKSWEETKQEFVRQQNLIVAALREKDDTFLEEEFLPGKKFGWLVQGVIDHDLYHLGQIAFVRGLIRASV